MDTYTCICIRKPTATHRWMDGWIILYFEIETFKKKSVPGLFYIRNRENTHVTIVTKLLWVGVFVHDKGQLRETR